MVCFYRQFDWWNQYYLCLSVGRVRARAHAFLLSLSLMNSLIYIYYWFHQIIFAGVCYTHPPPYSYRKKREICEKQDYFVIRCTALKSSCQAESQFVTTRAEISFCRHQARNMLCLRIWSMLFWCLKCLNSLMTQVNSFHWFFEIFSWIFLSAGRKVRFYAFSYV